MMSHAVVEGFDAPLQGRHLLPPQLTAGENQGGGNGSGSRARIPSQMRRQSPRRVVPRLTNPPGVGTGGKYGVLPVAAGYPDYRRAELDLGDTGRPIEQIDQGRGLSRLAL